MGLTNHVCESWDDPPSSSLRIFQHSPGTYPRPQPRVYEGIPFIWGFGDSWGMLPGYVGVLLEAPKISFLINRDQEVEHRFLAKCYYGNQLPSGGWEFPQIVVFCKKNPQNQNTPQFRFRNYNNLPR